MPALPSILDFILDLPAFTLTAHLCDSVREEVVMDKISGPA